MIVCASRLFHISLVVSKTTGWLVPRHPNNSIIRETGRDGSRRTTVLASVSPSSSDFSIFDGQDEKQASDNVAERLREDARKLRAEIEEYEKRKQDIAMIERENIEAELKARQKMIDRYSVVVPVLKADGTTVNETIQFPPMLEESSGRTGSSKILLCEAAFPLGILLGEHQQLEGMTTVDEVVAGSNGELAGIKEGDLLRACTACKVELEQPTWQLIVGGIGRPKTVRYMFSADFKPFELVMEAMRSNRMDPEGRPLSLVVERNESLG